MDNKKYEIYLLDADGTLLDFDQAEEISFANMLQDFAYESDQNLIDIYHLINRSLWHEMALGNIAKEELLHRRFEIFSQETGILLEPALANLSFLTHLSYQGLVYPGAKEVLVQLKKRGQINIATNGVAFVQRRRFALSGLLPLIDNIFISETLGAEKPEALFFEMALSILGNPDPDTVLMVGDSPVSDIRGASNFGLDSCLYDPDNIHSSSEASYIIRDLTELLEL